MIALLICKNMRSSSMNILSYFANGHRLIASTYPPNGNCAIERMKKKR